MRRWVRLIKSLKKSYVVLPIVTSFFVSYAKFYTIWGLKNELEVVIISFSNRVLMRINLQPRESQAKSYQVKQVRDLIVKYDLLGNEDEEEI